VTARWAVLVLLLVAACGKVGALQLPAETPPPAIESDVQEVEP
jgi:predicted small lipoprotein YifL